MYIFKQPVVLLLVLACAVMPAQAQKVRALGKATEAALSRELTTAAKAISFNRSLGVYGFIPDKNHNMAQYTHMFGYGTYNPVLGNQIKNMPAAVTSWNDYEMFHAYKLQKANNFIIQVAPYTQLSAPLNNIIVSVEDATLPQLTEAIYLLRLTHPSKELSPDGLLVKRAKKLIEDETLFYGKTIPTAQVYELPNITFLKRLLDPKFSPKTYGTLVETTSVYPKHVTLNVVGFPVPTAEAQQARLLDNYLMLSHPKVMGRFNSANINMMHHKMAYTPFVLTKEERMAAEELLAKRHEVAAVPDQATPRQLLEIAYNHLETHTVPYNSPEVAKMWVHFAYPEYTRTKLYQEIKKTINAPEQADLRESTDVSHLVVLDGVMGGITFENADEFFRVLDAFEKLCREVPATPENIAHLQLLHDAIVRAPGFWEFMPDTLFKNSDFPELESWQIQQMRSRIAQFAKTDIRTWAIPKVDK